MKKKVTVFVAVASVILILVIGITAWGITESGKQSKEIAAAITDKWVVRKDALQTKSFELEDGSEKSLSYSSTNTLAEDNPIDVYKDENNEEYRFNNNGDLVGYYYGTNRSTTDLEQTIATGESEIIRIATEHAKKMYSNVFAEYSFNYCSERQQEYYVEFAIRYGDNGFIIGETIGVMVEKDGTIQFSGLTDVGIGEDFDDSLLQGITEEAVLASVDEQIRTELGSKLVDYDIDHIRLIYEDERYVLRISVSAELKEYSEGFVYYYELNG